MTNNTTFDRQQDLLCYTAQAKGRTEAYVFIDEAVALMNSTNLTKAEKRAAIDEFITHANDIYHNTGNVQKDWYAKLAALRGLRRLI
tara:strand:+ start:170 stop:430 length:261 start_codon:yes stop_codon:yes gene_type:complete